MAIETVFPKKRKSGKEPPVNRAPHLSSVIIYWSPTDYPGVFVARRFYGDFATSDVKISPEINNLRFWAQEQCQKWNNSNGLNFGRFPEDDLAIVELWL